MDTTPPIVYNPISAWYLKDLILPLVVTFLTYLGTHFVFVPVTKWQKVKDEMTITLIQYANYKAYTYTTNDGIKNLKIEDYIILLNKI